MKGFDPKGILDAFIVMLLIVCFLIVISQFKKLGNPEVNKMADDVEQGIKNILPWYWLGEDIKDILTFFGILGLVGGVGGYIAYKLTTDNEFHA